MRTQSYIEGDLRIEIGQGVLYFRESGGNFIENFYDDTVCPMGSRKYNADVVRELPPIEVMYNIMVKLGYDAEKIIDELLAMYHLYRNFKVDYLEDAQLMIGFIGYRRIGKSASIAKIIAEDYLLPGKRVWSNIPFKFEVYYKDASKVFESEEMTKLELIEGNNEIKDGVVVLDEVNLEVAEATKYMSNTNLEFTNQLQMAGKKGVDVLWSAQNWNTIDPRLKFQSDYIVLCSCENPTQRGQLTYWRVMDTTGLSGKLDFDLEMRSHYLLDKVVMEGNAYIRPWWLAYPSKKMLGGGNYHVKDLKQERTNAFFNEIYQYALDCMEKGIDRIVKADVYQKYFDRYISEIGNNIRGFQTMVGQAFSVAGYRQTVRRGNTEAMFRLPIEIEEGVD